jgi:hypothetical protein
MALVKCIECGSEISDRALSCPSCGCPSEFAPVVSAPVRPQAVRVSEVQFTSKRLKLYGLLSAVLVIAGIIVGESSTAFGWGVALPGILLNIWVRVMMWWNHA